MKKEYKIIAMIYLSLVVLRLFYGFQADNFSDTDSYFTLRQIDNIKKTGLPLFNDPLSYSGRTFFFLPLFTYFLTLVSIILPGALKVFTNMLAATIVFPSYLIAYNLTSNKRISYLTSILVGLSPFYFQNTINSLTDLTFTIPLSFIVIHLFMRLRKNANYAQPLIITLCLLVLSSSASIVLILGLVMYLALLFLEKLPVDRREIEVIFFSGFLYLWTNFVFYKKALLDEGINIIFQNAPIEIIRELYSGIGIFDGLSFIGFLPIVASIYVTYKYLFKIKNPKVYLIIGLCGSIFILLLLRFISIELSLSYLCIGLSLFFSLFFKHALSYLRRTKVNIGDNIIYPATLVLIILSVMPALIGFPKEFVTTEQINALEWINQNTPKDAVVLGTIDEGHLISYFAKRKNVADTNFVFIKDVDKISKNIQEIYTDSFKIDAIRLLNEYDISYIYYANALETFGPIIYIDDPCFELIYDESVKVYESKCKINE